MQLLTSLLLTFSFLLTLVRTLPQDLNHGNYLFNPMILPAPICSADTSTAPPSPFASDPAWAPSMLNCLSQLNNTIWNGYHCLPTNGKGTAIGPSFGFYKGNENFAKMNLWDGWDCYRQCEACLTKGIKNGQGVSTSCTWYPGQKGSKCWMGFNYGG